MLEYVIAAKPDGLMQMTVCERTRVWHEKNVPKAIYGNRTDY